jgi:hypothetical protein
VGELSQFSVSAGKDVGQTAGHASPISEQSSYSLFLFGLPMQAVEGDFIAFHNAMTEDIKSKLCVVASLGESQSPVPGWPQSDWQWYLRGKHLLHPDQFHADQPVMSQLTETVSLLDGALRGRLDFGAFKSRLDRIGLPIDWRNHLINEVFQHAETPPLPLMATQSSASDPLASLLDQVSIPGATQSSNAAQAFIQQVGADSTGYSLNKTMASTLLEAFQAFRKHLQAHAEKAGLETLFGWGAGLSALMKRLRGRSRQIGWLVPPEANAESLRKALADHQGPVEVLVLAGFTTWEEAMTSAYQNLLLKAKTVLIQVGEGHFAAFKESVAASGFGEKIYLMQGTVRCAFGNDLCALKPAALAYVEACLQVGVTPHAAKDDVLTLDDQDPCPGRSERHVAERMLPDSEWVPKCRSGQNWLNGKLGTAQILFRPLTPSQVSP